MFGRERRTEWRWQNTSFVPGGNVRVVVVQATDPSPAPHTVLVRRDGRTPPCSVCSQRTHVGAPGGPDVRQALERPVMLAYARRFGRYVTRQVREAAPVRREDLHAYHAFNASRLAG